ncbi:MAG: CBS domain-containing protein [Candidatus Korarchaeota archaeon]|nr:CBS domain-containing protein [Candidatus Korarchaeota archaeon]
MSRNKQVSELMNRQVVTIDKGEIVEVALDLMERNDINHLVVTSDEKVVGILSIRDIMEGLGSFRFQKIPARRIYVSALMTEPPVTIKPTNTIDEAIEVMSEQEIGSLPVVDDGRLLGIITETDIIRLLSANESIENLVKEDHPKIMPN